MDDIYAQNSATPSIREAFFPSLVMDGAIKPMTIRGTQKLIISARIYLIVTTKFITASPTFFTDSIPASCPRNNPEYDSHNQFERKAGKYFFHVKSSLYHNMPSHYNSIYIVGAMEIFPIILDKSHFCVTISQ